MKKYNLLMILVIVLFAAGTVCANMFFPGGKDNSNRLYNLEASRLVDMYDAAGEITESDIASCRYITGMDFLMPKVLPSDIPSVWPSISPSDMRRFFDGGGYLVRALYRDNEFSGYVKFYYNDEGAESNARVFLLWQNGLFAVMFVIIMFVLMYIRYTVIRPLSVFRVFPEVLAKGDYTTLIKSDRGHFLEHFLRELDMLRETLRFERQRVLTVEKEKAQTALSLSHDIKTPLGAIMLCVKALREGLYHDSEKRNDLLVKIDDRTREIQSLLVRLQAGVSELIPDLPVKNGEFYLDDVITRTDEAWGWRMELTGTRFEMGAHDNCLLKGDPDRMFEALCNLLENAMKYGDGQCISLGFSQEEGCQLITVTNSGNSLSPEESVHIFDSFWRGSNARGKPGNGLGLYIVRRLCVKMGGEAFATLEGDQMSITMVFCYGDGDGDNGDGNSDDDNGGGDS